MVVTNDETVYKRACRKHDSAMRFWNPDGGYTPQRWTDQDLDDAATAINKVARAYYGQQPATA